MSFILVKNKNGTTGKHPDGHSSWLDFWETKKGKKADTCERLGCSSKAVLGGHVIKSGEGGKEYILPLCSSCNNSSNTDEFKAWDTDLISVK